MAAYARSSSNLLTRLIMQDQLDSYGWEVNFTSLALLITHPPSSILLPSGSQVVSVTNGDIIYLQCIFRTPLNNYDAVILLHRDKMPYPERLLFPSELNHGMLKTSC